MKIKLLLSVAMVLSLVSCSKETNFKNHKPDPILTTEERDIIRLANNRLMEEELGHKREFNRIPTSKSLSENIINASTIDKKIYEYGKQAFKNYESGSRRIGNRTAICLTPTNPTLESTDSLLGRDIYTQANSEVIAVAQRLVTPQEIFSFVKHDIKNELLFGATKTANRTLRLRTGSVADKANLLVALFRTNQIPAYFISGEIYLKDAMAKRLFEVKNTANLFSVLYSFFDNYFVNGKGAGADVFKMVNGEPFWIVPHLWVRAYHDGDWHTYDPTQLNDAFDTLGSDHLEVSQEINWESWFFQPDSDGQYVKPRTVIDFLMQTYNPSRTIFDINLVNSFSLEQRPEGVLSNAPPCITGTAFNIENSAYEYRAGVVVKDTSAIVKLSYSSPLAVLSENLVFLSHSAGLLADLSTPLPSGNVELRVGEQIVANFSSVAGSEYKISAFLVGPEFWSSTSFNDQFGSSYIAGDVFHFNIYGGSIASADLSLGVKSVLDAIDNNLSNRFLMARLLRIAGQLYEIRSESYRKDLKRIRNFSSIPTSISGTYTKNGGIAAYNQSDKEFGLVPFTGGIDQRLSGYILASDSSMFTDEGLEEIRIASEEELASGSEAEATVWEELFGVRGYSANRILQMGAMLKAAGQSFNLISGIQFNATSNAHIASLLDTSSQFYLQKWTSINSNYGQKGGRIWALSKEVTDPQGGAKAYGYMIYRKSIFDEGVAAFDVLYSGTPPVPSEPLGFFESGIENRENDNLLDRAFQKLEATLYKVIRGGGSAYVSEPQKQPEDGKSAGNGPSTPGVATSSRSSCLPVDFATGRMWHTFTDFNLRGRTANTGLRFQRTYFTLPQYSTSGSWVANGDLGKGWVHSYDTRLLDGFKDSASGLLSMGSINSTTQNIVWISSEGNPILFTNSGTPSAPIFNAPAGFVGSLTVDGSTYVLTLKGNIRYIFKKDLGSNYNGRLLSILETHGEMITLSYDSNGQVISASSNLAGTLNFVRNESDQLIKIKSSKTGLEYQYGYANGKLAYSTDFDGRTTLYEYNSNQVGTKAEGLLTAIVDPIGRRIEFDYYQNGKVFREKDFGGSVQTYQYAPYLYQKYTRVTSPNGFTTEYRYDDNFRVTEIVYPDGGRQYQKWNASGFMEYETDSLGHKVSYTYDTRGNRTGIKRPMDLGYQQISYDQVFDQPTSITPLEGSPSIFSLDSQTGDVLQIHRTSESKTLFQKISYDSAGSPKSFTHNLNTFSNITNTDGLTVFAYDSLNPQSLSYDQRGRLQQRQFKNGRVLRFGYDNYDRVVSLEDSHGPDVRNKYDDAGRLVETIRSSANIQQTAKFEYDDRDRLISSLNFNGEKTIYKYDLVGVGCLIQDKPTKIISPLGKVTSYVYDFAGRKTLEVMPNGDQISFKYNVRGDLIATIDPKGLLTQFEYDANGRLARTLYQSAMSRPSTDGVSVGHGVEETYFFYDSANRMIRKEQKLANEAHVNGRYVTEFSYDSMDRIVQKKVSQKRGDLTVEEFDKIKYEYLDILTEQLLSFVGNKYVNLHFSYQTQPPYYLTGYKIVPTAVGLALGMKASSFRVSPSMNGPLAQIEREGAILIKNGYDEAGKLISSWAKLGSNSSVVAIGYDEFARRNLVSHSNGLIGNFTYDNVDRISTINWTGAGISKSEVLTHNKEGLVTQAVRDSGTQTFNYNLKNEISLYGFSGSESLPAGENFSQISYDAAGNMASYRNEGYQNFHNFQTKIGSVYYWPDFSGFGRMISESRGIDTRSVSYLPDGKIREFKLYSNGALSRTVKYYYDGLGRRVAKVKDFVSDTDSTVTYTHLGLADKVLLASVTKGAITNETLFADGQDIDDHLFEISTSTGVKSYATDHLGSVLNSNALGGKSIYGLFGRNLGTAADVNSNTEPLVYGYTGREYDSESGYNNHRWRILDTYTGTFLTKDPLGPHEGGDINTYRYAGNNPVNFMDPNGQCPTIIAGAVVGSVAGAATAYLNNQNVLGGAVAGGLTGAAIGAGGFLFGAAAGEAGIGMVGTYLYSTLGGVALGYPTKLATDVVTTGNTDLVKSLLSVSIGSAVGSLPLSPGYPAEIGKSISTTPVDFGFGLNPKSVTPLRLVKP